jgi:hypothetical protein
MTDDTKRARDLPGLLVQSLEKLAVAGETEAACRLAGEAYVLLRLSDPRGAQRFNALLHRLTRPRPAPAAPTANERP